jgi:hypothetical protein
MDIVFMIFLYSVQSAKFDCLALELLKDFPAFHATVVMSRYLDVRKEESRKRTSYFYPENIIRKVIVGNCNRCYIDLVR